MCPTRVTSPSATSLPPVRRPATTPGPVATPAVSRPADSFSGARVFPQTPRRWGAWAWNTGDFSSPAKLDALLAAQKGAGASELYFNAYPVQGRERLLKDAVTRAKATGLAPQLLLGAPEWASPATRPWLERAIVAPLKTLRAAVPTATAPKLPLHLDIEPHAAGPLTPQVMRDYLDTLRWFATKLGPGFSLQVDIPAWYQGQSVDGKPFTQAILERVEGVTLMAYERTVSQALAEVAPTLAQAARLGKQALVAVEVGPQYARFGLGTQAGVRRYLSQLDAALAGAPGYGGCAVHELDAMKRLPP